MKNKSVQRIHIRTSQQILISIRRRYERVENNIHFNKLDLYIMITNGLKLEDLKIPLPIFLINHIGYNRYRF